MLQSLLRFLTTPFPTYQRTVQPIGKRDMFSVAQSIDKSIERLPQDNRLWTVHKQLMDFMDEFCTEQSFGALWRDLNGKYQGAKESIVSKVKD